MCSVLLPKSADANCAFTRSCCCDRHTVGNLLSTVELGSSLPQGGVANFTQSPELLLQYVTALLASPSSTPAAPAQLVNVSSSADNLSSSALAPGVAPLVAPGPLAAAAPSDEQSAPAPAPAPATAAAEAAAAAAAADYGNWSISCPVPAGYDATVPAVLWSVTDVQNGTASAIGIALAGSGKALARAAVWEVSPPVGPTAGGTNITIQVRRFEHSLVFRNLNLPCTSEDAFQTEAGLQQEIGGWIARSLIRVRVVRPGVRNAGICSVSTSCGMQFCTYRR